MADLIAQGAQARQRWRRPLAVGEIVVLGRATGVWGVPWDDRVSREHVEIRFNGQRLKVHRLPTARNPVYLRGQEEASFELTAGEHFVIGNTTFSLSCQEARATGDTPPPVEEKTFAPQYLQEIRFRNPDHRIEILSRVPEVISGATSDDQLFTRLVNLLLSGIQRADAAAVVAVCAPDTDPIAIEESSSQDSVEVLYWDRRLADDGGFQPSERLVREAIQRKQSVLHVWESTGSIAEQTFTINESSDWAFCTPVTGEGHRTWGIYVTGRFAIPGTSAPTPTDATDLRDDVKFAEMVAETLSSLRTVQRLQERQLRLGQFFSPRVLEALANEDADHVLSPREADVSVLFCDLRGFSLESEKWADDLFGLLKRVSEALGVLTHHILEQGGVVGDFQGDAAMGFWGWPLQQPDAVERACRAALAIRTEFESAARKPGHTLSGFRMGIGLATGKAVAGKIGTLDQVKVTVFGPVVNLASRLEGMTKILRAAILLDESTAAAVRDRLPADVARLRRLATVRPYGMDTPVTVSELLPPAAEYPRLTDQHLRSYESAVDAVAEGRWSEAIELLHQVPADDLAKDFLTMYIVGHNRTPPPDWDGIIPLTSKS